MRVAHLAATAIVAAVLGGSASAAAAQGQPSCRVLCAPTLLLEPTWTVERLARRPKVIDAAGSISRLPRQSVFELVVAVDVPTRLRRIGVTAESIFSPASTDNEVELEFELNLALLHKEQTRGWVSSHLDIVDQFGPAAVESERAYVHRLDFELDTAFAVFKRAPSAFLRPLELELSLDYLASGLPRPGDSVDGGHYLDAESPWSLSLVLVIPIAPR